MLNEQTSLYRYINIVNCVSLCSGPASWQLHLFLLYQLQNQIQSSGNRHMHCHFQSALYHTGWSPPKYLDHSLIVSQFPKTYPFFASHFSSLHIPVLQIKPNFSWIVFFFFLLECFLWSLFYTIPSPHQIEIKMQTSEYNLQRQTVESFSKLFCLKPIIVFSRKPNWFCSPWRAWCCKNQIRFQQLIMGITFLTWCRRDLYYIMYVITMKLYIYNIGIQSLQWDTFIRAFPDSLNCLFWRRYQPCYSFSQDPSITEKTRL